jgi:hypothetical protein
VSLDETHESTIAIGTTTRAYQLTAPSASDAAAVRGAVCRVRSHCRVRAIVATSHPSCHQSTCTQRTLYCVCAYAALTCPVLVVVLSQEQQQRESSRSARLAVSARAVCVALVVNICCVDIATEGATTTCGMCGACVCCLCAAQTRRSGQRRASAHHTSHGRRACVSLSLTVCADWLAAIARTRAVVATAHVTAARRSVT